MSRLNDCMKLSNLPTTVGKYLISPLCKRLEDGRWAASVSIRSGRGSGTLDRVLRFVPRFGTDEEALRYAADQGLTWVCAPATR